MPAISGLPAGATVAGANLFAGVQDGITNKVSADQIKAYIAEDGSGINVISNGSDRTLAEWTGDVFSPDGRSGTTHVAVQAALDAAEAAGGGTVLLPPGSEWQIGATLTVAQGVFLNGSGAWLKPSADVNVVRGHGGSRGAIQVDTRDFVGWNSSALLFDGDSEGNAATAFRLYTPTEWTAYLVGTESGTGNGIAAEFTAETAAKSWLMGIKLTAWVRGFDIACRMAAGSGNRFCNSNDIWISASEPLQGLVMETGQTYAVDGNTIQIRSQIRPLVSTNPHVVIIGQLNEIMALPWDWDGGSGGTVMAITVGANARDSQFVFYAEAAYIQDNSTAAQNSLTVLGPDSVQPLYRDANGDTWLKGSTVAGDIVNIDAPNATGQVFLRVDGAIAYGTDSNRHFYFPGNAGTANAVSIRNFNTAAHNQDICNGTGILSIKAAVPASASAAGALGMWAEDDSYFYVCTAADTWKRVAIATWP